MRVLLGVAAVVLLLPGTATAAEREPLWVQHLDVPDPELYTFAEGIALDPGTGNVYVGGYRCPRDPCRGSTTVTAAYSPAGDLLWQDLYDGAGTSDRVAAIAVDPTTGTVVVAGSSSNAAGFQSLLTIAYDNAGNQLWLARHAAEFESEGLELAVDGRRGQIYVGGRTGYGSPDFDLDYLTVAYDLAGAELWAATYDGPAGTEPAYDQFEGIAVDPNRGTVLAAGSSGSDLTGDYDVVTVAYSPTGQPLWTATYDGPASRDDWIFDVEVDPRRGTTYVAGQVEGPTRTDIVTVAYDAAGRELWSDTYDGPAGDLDYATDLGVDSRTGDVYVTGGSANRRNNDYDWATVAYSATGTRLWVGRYGGPRNDFPDEVAVNRSNGTVYVAGLLDGTVTIAAYSAAGVRLGATQYVDAPSGDLELGLVLDVPRRRAYVGYQSYGPDGERPVGMTTVAYGVG